MPESDNLESVDDWLPAHSDASGPIQNSKTLVGRLDADNAKLREQIEKLQADLEWAVEFTRLDGYPKHPRMIANIIKERDEAYAQLAQLGKMLNLLLGDLREASTQISKLGIMLNIPQNDLQESVNQVLCNIEEMKTLTIKDTHTLPHVRSLASFLTLVYDTLLTERRFYEAVIGKPLEWIPIRTEVINDIESRIRVFDGTYDFGQRICDGRDPRVRTITAAQGGGNKASKR